MLIAMALHPSCQVDMSDLDHPDHFHNIEAADAVDLTQRVATVEACRAALQQQAKEWVVEAALEVFRDAHGRPGKPGAAPAPAPATAAASSAAAWEEEEEEDAAASSDPMRRLLEWKRRKLAAAGGGAGTEAAGGGGAGGAAGGDGAGGEKYEAVRERVLVEHDAYVKAKQEGSAQWTDALQSVGGDDLRAYKHLYAIRFPLLATVYLAYAAIPASSAGAESLFSGAGAVASSDRPNLGPEQISKQVMISDNWDDCLLDVTVL